MPITVCNKLYQTPRELKGYGDAGCSYTYSGITHVGRGDWPGWVLEAKRLVEEATGAEYNTVIISRYRNGLDHIGWHADSEQGIVPGSTIAGLSLGATRDFKIKGNITAAWEMKIPGLRTNRDSSVATIAAEHGMIITMEDNFQQRYQHCVPRRTGKNVDTGVRVSLTFRKMIVK